MKITKLITIGLIFIMFGSFANAETHNEVIEPLWQFIGGYDEIEKAPEGYANYVSTAISEDYVVRTLSVGGIKYMDQSCVDEWKEIQSPGYINAVCVKTIPTTDNAYFMDIFGNKKLDYSPGGGSTDVFISGNYAVLSSSNNMVHLFKVNVDGVWKQIGKYTTEKTPKTVHIVDNFVYAGDANTVYSLNKETAALNWKYTSESPVTEVYGIGDVVIAGTDAGVCFINKKNGKLIKKQETGIVKSIHVDESYVAVGAGDRIYLFDTVGNLKFDYAAEGNISDIKVSSSKGEVAAGAGSTVYVLDTAGDLKNKFEVSGVVDTINLWGEFVGAGVISNDSYHYLFDDKEVIDIRHGEESKEDEPGIKVKSVINNGNYAVVIHSNIYGNNTKATRDEFKFYNLGFVRTHDALSSAQDAVNDLEEIEFEIIDASNYLEDALNSFEDDNYPEAYKYAKLSEDAVVNKINELINEANTMIGDSKKEGMISSGAESELTKAKNSLNDKKYGNAIIHAKSSKDLIVGETTGSVEGTWAYYNSIKNIEEFTVTMDIDEVGRELNLSNKLIGEGRYLEAKKHSDTANEHLTQGLENYAEICLNDAEKKVAEAKGIFAQSVQAETMAIAQENLDKAKKAFEEGRKSEKNNNNANTDKLLEVLEFAGTAEMMAGDSKTRAIAQYLMLTTLIIVLGGTLVIMMRKPKYPEAHYPGVQAHGHGHGHEEHDESGKDKEHDRGDKKEK